MLNLVYTRTPSSFSDRLPSSWMALSIFWCLGLFPTGAGLCTSYCTWSSCWSISSVSQAPSVWQHDSGVPATPLGCVSSARVLWVHCLVIQMTDEDVEQSWTLECTASHWLELCTSDGYEFSSVGLWAAGRWDWQVPWLAPAGTEGSLCEQNAVTQGDVFTRDFAWRVGRGAFRGRCVFVL